MAEKEPVSISSGPSTLDPPAQSAIRAPSAGGQGVLPDRGLSLSPHDSSEDAVVQPFPRSPKLLRRLAEAENLSEEQLSRRVEELQAEQCRTQNHIQSLKKRKVNLSRTTEAMKTQVQERFEGMRSALKKDERAVLYSLELDLTETSSQLDQVLKNWDQHLIQVSKTIASTQRALGKSHETEGDLKDQPGNLSPKKPDTSEATIRLNDGRFERLLKTLSFISKDLKAQLQRKTLLLDASPVMIDRQTCHSQISVTTEGRGMWYSNSAHSAPEHPLQFDKVCCALGLDAVTSGRSYWEVDVRCCSAWTVGVAYSCLERRGRDKSAKLGRNRNSWCVELCDGHLFAWHNDRNVACQVTGRAPPGKVGVWVNYGKGQLAFYDADNMKVLQEFSAALAPVFDRAHHQFTEPLYPAMRFLRPPESQIWPNHMAICNLNAP